MPDFGFQDDGVSFLKQQPRALLGDEPGLGKTRQLLLGAVEPVLVVAPAMVLDAGVWQDEVARWTPGLDIRAVSYSSLSGREKTEKGGTRPTGLPRAEYKQRWGTVIFDEAHYLKGRKTSWALAALKLECDRTYLATGTPIPNYADELFMLLRHLWPGDKRFTSYWRWIDTWFDKFKPPWGGTQILGLQECNKQCVGVCEHWIEFHRQNLGERYLARLRDDVLDDLPPLTETTILCKMGAAQKRAYKEIKKDFVTWVESQEVAAWNTATQTVRLAQISCGLESLPGSPGVGSAKLDMLDELMADRHQQSSLILGHFHTTLESVKLRMLRHGLEAEILDGRTPKGARKGIKDAFQRGDIQVLVGGLGVISEGLTLTRADFCAFVEHSWRPSTNVQALRRVHRIGQERPVTAVHLVTEGTIDEGMRRTITGKTDQQVKALSPHHLLKLA